MSARAGRDKRGGPEWQDVVVHLKDKATLTGTVLQAARNPSGFLVVKTAGGANYVNPGEIAYIEAKGAAKALAGTEKQKRSVLVLTVAKTDKKPAITLSYLTHGLSWAPSYRVEIADDQRDVLEALRLLLKPEGFSIEAATSPAGVLDALGSHEFDAVLIDLEMRATG